MLLPFSTDRLMPPEESMSVATELGKDGDVLVHCEVLRTNMGHDAFLVRKPREQQMLSSRIKVFLAEGITGVRALVDSHCL